jgi:hypothetical protein
MAEVKKPSSPLLQTILGFLVDNNNSARCLKKSQVRSIFYAFYKVFNIVCKQAEMLQTTNLHTSPEELRWQFLCSIHHHEKKQSSLPPLPSPSPPPPSPCCVTSLPLSNTSIPFKRKSRPASSILNRFALVTKKISVYSIRKEEAKIQFIRKSMVDARPKLLLLTSEGPASDTRSN